MSFRIKIWLIGVLVFAASHFVLAALVPMLNIKMGGVDLLGFGKKYPVKLGLDLQGGVQMVLRADTSKIDASQVDQAVESAVGVIEKRVNLFGVSESLVQVARSGGERRIIVEIPGIADASAAASLVGRTAQLEFREMSSSVSAALVEATQAAGLFDTATGLTGADLKSATVTFGSGGQGGKPEVALEFNSEGARKFAEITRRNVGAPVAIFLDDELLTSPVVQQEIIGGNALINGDFSVDEAKTLSVQLNAGALAVPVEILSIQQVSATLGQESVMKSLVAGVIGLASVAVFMALYYGKLGLVADVALFVYAVVVLAIFQTGAFLLPPVVLTLAGIAGFVLSIGMAVDANILIFERMKEELRGGYGYTEALNRGFARAWTSIRDSNFSSLLSAFILYYFGSGAVRGFAIALAIGVLVSMFSAIIVTRTLLGLVVRGRKI